MKAIEMFEKLGMDPDTDIESLPEAEKQALLKEMANYMDIQAQLNIAHPDEDPSPEPGENP